MDRVTQKHILNVLRRGTLTWPGRSEAMRRASKKVFEGRRNKMGEKILKTFWKCAHCKEWFRNSVDVEVDHIVEVGPFCGDLNIYASRMYCSQGNLQVLCYECHLVKTQNFNCVLMFERKKPCR